MLRSYTCNSGIAVGGSSSNTSVTFTLDNREESVLQRQKLRDHVVHCRPYAFSRNSEMMSAYVGVAIVLVMAVYARY